MLESARVKKMLARLTPSERKHALSGLAKLAKAARTAPGDGK